MSEGIKRRDFLKVMGVTGAGAATVGCGTAEVERLIPYVIPSEEIVPGVPTWYTSTCRECPAGCGIHVETHSGRVTKVEGNPDHPINHGNLCPRGQASVQGLYHPDRYRGPATRETGLPAQDVTWGTAERLLAERIRELQQAGRASSIVFLTQEYTGTMDRLADAWVGAIGARRVVYDVWRDQPRDLDLSRADVLVSFGADFMETWGSPVEYAWQYAQMRDYRDGRRGKFVWVGPHRPLTGLNADQWIAPRPGSEHILALALAGQVDAATAARETEVSQETIVGLAREFSQGNGMAIGPGAAITGRNTAQLRRAIAALNGAGAAGQAGRSQNAGTEMLRLVEQMNAGQVQMLLIDAPNPAYTLPGALGFADALQRVPTRVSFATFPDQTSLLATMILPDHHFLEAWGDYVPEPGVSELVQPAMRPVFNTKQVGDVLLSVASQLGVNVGGGATTYYDYLRASWQGISGGGDGWRQALQRGGVYPGGEGAGNPTDRNLDNLGVEGGSQGTGAAGFVPLVGGATTGETTPAATEARNQSNIATSGQAPVAPQADTEGMTAGGESSTSFDPPQTEGEGSGSGDFHLVVYPSLRFYDGRTANRPWLLELPDPVTKISWMSWVELHPRAAERIGVDQGDIVEVASPHGSVRAPVYIWPGVRPDTIAIQAGLGHEAFGRYNEGRGINPNTLLGATIDEATGGFASYGTRVRVTPTGDDPNEGRLPFMPGEGLFEEGVRVQHDRELAQAVSLAEVLRLEQHGAAMIPGQGEPIAALRGSGGFAPAPTTTDPAEYPPPGTHYGQYIEGATRWAMVVDLDRCIGCAACEIACNAENNIPVVGPTEVKKGRRLSWMRIERYFGVSRHEEEAYADNGTDDVRFLPMLCQHCGNAPCEPVCPVYAAYHTSDGLNGQVYNRCVGTRYCANNCPWKVRYFNWWTYDFPEPLNWQLNPDVTVREKGVMEKCTFCVQRIRDGERNAAQQNRQVQDGDVVPACVQTCPTEVFVFGNIQDPNSKVAQAARSVRGYRSLELLNTQPAIVYLKKVTLHEPARGGHHPAETVEGAAPAGAGAH